MISPQVSVILPTYNRAKLLPRAINSVLIQNYRNFELIVIDDASNDQTQRIIQQINDPRLRSIRLSKNRGVGFSRNIGIENARGEYIALHDSDDVWLPGKLDLQIMVLKEYPELEFVFSDYYNVNQVTNTCEFGFTQTHEGLDYLKIQQLSTNINLWKIIDKLPEAILIKNFIATPTVLFQANLLKRVGNYRKDLRFAGDFEFFWRAAIHGVLFGFLRQSLIERHKNEDSITANVTQFAPHLLAVYDACEQTAREASRCNLIENLNKARSNIWISLIKGNALRGMRRDAMHAYVHSLKYGFSIRAFVYLLAAFSGPVATQGAKRLRDMLE